MRKGCKKKIQPSERSEKKWWKKCSFFLRFTTRRWFPALRNKILEGNVCKYFHRYEFLLCRFGLFFDTWIFSLGAFLKPQIAWCKIVNSIYCPVWGIYWNLSNLSNISLKKKKLMFIWTRSQKWTGTCSCSLSVGIVGIKFYFIASNLIKLDTFSLVSWG